MTPLTALAASLEVPGAEPRSDRVAADYSAERTTVRIAAVDLPGPREAWTPRVEVHTAGRLLSAWDQQATIRELPYVIGGLIGTLCAEDGSGTSALDRSEDAWLTLARLATAASAAADARAAGGDQAAALMAPLFWRCQFLVLAYGCRVAMAFAEDLLENEEVAAFRLRRARDRWAQALLNHSNHPILATFAPDQLEREARRLTYIAPIVRGSGLLSCAKLTNTFDAVAWSRNDPIQDSERRFIDLMSAEFFLRRMMFSDALHTAWGIKTGAGAGPYRAMLILPAVLLALCPVLLLAAVLFEGATWVLIHSAAVVAAAGYALAGVGVVWHGPRAAHHLLLRLPASCAIGAAAMVALDGGFWARDNAWMPIPVLLVAAGGYLAVEARAAGATGRTAVGRSLVVWLIGIVHALAVATITTVWVAPTLRPNDGGPSIHDTEAMATTIGLTASVALALGVFLQLLWEDRQVTYPLARPDRRS